jgi:hypothetical protein
MTPSLDPTLIERAAEAIHAQLCKRNGIDFPWASLDPDRREDFCDDARAALSDTEGKGK